MSTTGWGYFMQGNPKQEEIEEQGSRLSKILNCPVHWPAWGKDIYECKCGVLFPAFVVKGNSDAKLLQHHKEAWRPE